MRGSWYQSVTRVLFVVCLMMFTTHVVVAQGGSKVEKQRRLVEQYKRDLEKTEREVSDLKRQKGSATEQVQRLTEQMNLRTSYIAETEREQDLLRLEAEDLNRRIDSLALELQYNKQIYAEVVRVAHRHYSQGSETTYILSSTSISDAAHRMGNLRHIAQMTGVEGYVESAASGFLAAVAMAAKVQGRELVAMRNELKERREELDSIGRTLEAEHRTLKRDCDEAKRAFDKLSERERAALEAKKRQQKELEKATKELRKLTEGNKVGSGFSKSTKALNLPVEGGKTQLMQTNMVKISGTKGNAVRSIYEGKVVRIVTDNTNHSTVMIAHGHYVSVYSHLSQISVSEGDVVKRNEKIGTIGIGVDHKGNVSAYMQFMIINTKSSSPMNVMDCFKK